VPLGEKLVAELGSTVRFKHTDVSDAQSMKELIDFAVFEFGGLHVMCNNAGTPGSLFQSFLEDDLQDFTRVMGVNVYGVMLGTQYAARHMAKHGGGSVINIASLGGSVAGYGVMTYRAAKAAVIQFSKCAAIDLGEHNIRVNVINPGHIRTPLSSYEDTRMSEEAVQQLQRELDTINLADQPLKRLGTPDDVAHAALYLASDRSVQVTGIILPVDGGVAAGDTVNHVEQILGARAKAIDG
jgi:NAD(P)-dependent dehydrogenase (short-subunit alcohol dehydrogenase family)